MTSKNCLLREVRILKMFGDNYVTVSLVPRTVLQLWQTLGWLGTFSPTLSHKAFGPHTVTLSRVVGRIRKDLKMTLSFHQMEMGLSPPTPGEPQSLGA